MLASTSVSLIGTRVSLVALPWFVLVTSGSAARTGLIAFCELLPFVVGKALSGPLIDRLGPRTFSICSDAGSAALVGMVPLLHHLNKLSFGALLALVAAIGLARSGADTAKRTLMPDIAATAGLPLGRAVGLHGTLDRIAATAGSALAGGLIAATGPMVGLVVDAASFAVAAALTLTTAPRPARAAERGNYLAQLREGATCLSQDRLLRSIVLIVAVTNLLDTMPGALLIPVWAKNSGAGPMAIGLVGTALGGAAILGAACATVWVHRLPQRPTLLWAFSIAGAPRFLILALDVPLWCVLCVYAVSGFAKGFVNPILNTAILERTPKHLLGRVGALISAVADAGLPLGGMLAGLGVSVLGLAPTLLVTAGAYAATTAVAGVSRGWREFTRDRTRLTQKLNADTLS
ncbi:MFS transporter [Streptomyces mirabilis]|uniref:MFS transporter n=1 Tax=Streptomyces mirabilis TaxID=68239 RepID=UPI0037F78D23